MLWDRTRIPSKDSPAYDEYVSAFEVGTAALDVGVTEEAGKNLTRAVELLPREPAGWANRGLFHLRTHQLPNAARDLAEAERLAPDNPDIQKLLGLLDEQQGKYPEAAARFRKAIEKKPDDVEALFHLAGIVRKEDPLQSDKEYQELMERILKARPDNVYVLVERLRVAVRRSDRAAVNDTLAKFQTFAPGWSEQTREAFAELEKELAGSLGQEGLPLLTFGNVLKGEPAFARGADEVNPQAVGTPLRTFVKLPPPVNTPAPPDTGLTFTAEPLAGVPAGRWDAAVPVWMSPDGPPVVFVGNAQEVRRVGTGPALPSIPLAPNGLVPLDWNNDFRTDLLLVGSKGLRFYQQAADGNFTDVTAKTGLPADVIGGDYSCALAADVDLDGDLDIILGRKTGPPLLLRNNFDGTFTPQPIFPDVNGARAFAWADFDNDGAPDAAILDAAGKLHVFANERSGRFKRWPAALPDHKFLALAVADADDDGVLDLVAIRSDGAIVRVSDRDKRSRWDLGELARWEIGNESPDTIRLIVADLDNNGVPDLLVSRASAGDAWLGSGNGKFEQRAPAIPPHVTAAADLGNTGRLDLLALDGNGQPVRDRSSGTKNYHWQTVRFRALPIERTEGDNRINSFGVGGEIEVRSGTLVVKRPITGPVVHIGLGERARTDVVRIQWPNGIVQIEFRPEVDQTFSPQQRLKGSCPFLFAWNGERFAFVADFMWGTPLGMYINAQATGGGGPTTEWIRVRGDQLVPQDGKYELRAQANLWETDYFDRLALHVIDHPSGTELFVDERFALEPTAPAFHLTEPPRTVAKAWDHRGNDVTDIVRADDGVYLDRCGRGPYQGVTAEHWVEVDLGDDAPTAGTVWLIARGWIHPTDSSINYAMEQGLHTRPQGLVLEVPDGKGGWKIVRDKIGFPAGKNKTVLLRLDGLDGPGISRRFRLRTNLEIFWDSLRFARGRDDAEVRKTELLPEVADMRFRGILEMTQANPSSPELPDYDRIESRGQVWRDLIGFHTRFGNVRELLEKPDDRCAILTAGDEIALTFAVPPGPPTGWKRDFVWVSDGWTKDGDLNTRFGKTVLPLPRRGMSAYTGSLNLADDPVYRQHRKDWERYHTRYVTPTICERGLRVGRQP
jgi:Tfp pilus assembly protein PilF